MDLLPLIADERRQLAGLLNDFTDDQWAHPSLCEGWTNREVAAHLTMGLTVPLPKFMFLMLKARGDFNRAARDFAAVTAKQPTQSLVNTLRNNADHKFKPPGLGYEAPLTDIVIHGLDIRKPLGINRDIAHDRLRVVLDNLASPKNMKFFKLPYSNLQFTATDLDWSSGSGPLVSGPGADLALVLSGRASAQYVVSNLHGDGVASLRK
jgi:uncharacterized protein (TIGR03083 family)